MLGSVRDSHRLRVRKVSSTFAWQRVCLSIRFRGVSSEWSGSTAGNSPQQRQSQLRSSGWTPRRATRSISLVSWVDQAAAPVEVRLEAPAGARPADSPSAWDFLAGLAAAVPEVQAEALQVDPVAGHPEVPRGDRRGDRRAVLLIEHRLDTGPRTGLRSRQYRALFQFLHRSRHHPLRLVHLIPFQSGHVLQAPFQ